MARAVDRKISQVRVRWSVNRLLSESTRLLWIVGLLCVLLVLIERLLAFPLWGGGILLWMTAGGLSLLMYRWIPQIPSRLQTSLAIDERLQLRERCSSLLSLEGQDDPFARAACAEAVQSLADVKPARHFPIRQPRFLRRAVGAWLCVCLVHLFLPSRDLLGRRAQLDRERLLQQQQETVQNTIRETTAVVKEIAERLHEPDLEAALAALEQPIPASTPAQAQQQSIRRLGDLAERIRQSQSQTAQQAADSLRQSLKQLRPGKGDLSRQLQLALARGQFQQTSQLLRDLDQQLRQGDLSPVDQAAQARQLRALARQLENLSQEPSELAEALAKEGLDRDLALLDPGDLRAALKEQGLTDDAIETWLQQQAAGRLAQDRLGSLAEALAGAGAGSNEGLDAEGLAAALSQIDQLAGEDQDRRLGAAALAAIDQAIGALGQGMGAAGAGEKGPFRPGLSQGFSSGSGGPGQGSGEVDSDTSGLFDTQQTRIENAGEGGPTIASWYFRGSQSTGQTRRSWQDVLQASREQAAEAMEENQIPGRYRDSVKRYFSELEHTGDDP